MPTRAASATPATSRCGRATSDPSPSPPRGPRRGARAVPAGTSSAPRWRGSTSARPSTSTAAASTCASRTTRTSRPSRARPGHPFASYWMHNAWITTAGEKMSKSLGNSLLVPRCSSACAASSCGSTWSAAHYRSHVEFSFEALDEAAVGVPPDRDVPRARARPSRPRAARELPEASSPPWTTTSARRRQWPSSTTSCARATSSSPRSADASEIAGAVRAMLDVLGLDPADPAWATTGGADEEKLRGAIDVLDRRHARGPRDRAGRQGLGPGGRDPRPHQGGRHRDRRHALRAEVEHVMPGNSQRKGSVRKGGKGADRRLRRTGPARPRGQGPHARGQGPALPQGPQGREARRARRDQAPRAPLDQVDRRRVGGRSQLRRRGALGRHPGDGCLRRRGSRARRPTARRLQDGGRARLPAARGHPRRARPDDRRRRAPGPGRPAPVLRVRPRRRPARARRGRPASSR